MTYIFNLNWAKKINPVFGVTVLKTLDRVGYVIFLFRIETSIIKTPMENKRAQRALGRSPAKNVKGHSGANNREPQGHNLNNFGRGPFDDVIY